MKAGNKNRLIIQLKRYSILATVLVFSLMSSRSVLQNPVWVAPKDAEGLKNPLAGNTTANADIGKLYIANCGPCHGDKGRGDGPAAPGLNPKPADHTSAAIQKESDGAIFWKISTGRSPMPGYKTIFSEQQRWELVNYIRTLAKAGKKK